MKSIIILATIVATLVLIGCTKTAEQSTIQTASIKVESAVCGTCGDTITEALKGIEGVQEASVDIEKKVATVQFLTAKTDLSKLERAVAEAGYDANDIKRNSEAYEKLDSCCKIGEMTHE